MTDPLYIGWRHERVRGEEYDGFVEAFVSAVSERWPHVLLQWEDFANANAHRLLERYRGRLCTFNDDIQGTAAVAAAALLAAINVTGTKLSEQRVVLFGAGSAGCGIGTLLLKAMIDAGMSEADAKRNFYAVDRHGLLVDGMNDIHAPQRPFVQSRRALGDWRLRDPNRVDLIDVVANARPTALIAVSGQTGALTEPIVREMAAHVERPIIFPLSNPTSRAEATPAQLLAWTEGRAIVSTGSPFPPVNWQNELRRDRSDEQFLHLPGLRARRSRIACAARDRCDVHGVGQGARRSLARAPRQARTAAAAGDRAAQGRARCCGGRGEAGGGGRRGGTLRR